MAIILIFAVERNVVARYDTQMKTVLGVVTPNSRQVCVSVNTSCPSINNFLVKLGRLYFETDSD